MLVHSRLTSMPQVAQRPDQLIRARHAAEHSTLYLDKLDGGQVVPVIGGAAAVLQQKALQTDESDGEARDKNAPV
jgi:hypothetical protein